LRLNARSATLQCGRKTFLLCGGGGDEEAVCCHRSGVLRAKLPGNWQLFLPWRWFSAAGDIVTETLLAANQGRYAEASENLIEVRRSYQTTAAEEKALWDSITRNGTISKVIVLDETKTLRLGSADVKIEIHYRDGFCLKAEEGCYFQDGRWKLSLGRIMAAFREAQEAQEKERALPANTLPQDYTPVKGTGVALRLPNGFEWDEKLQSYVHPHLGIAIRVLPGLEYSLEWTTALRVQEMRKSPRVLADEDVTIGKTTGKLWTCENYTAEGMARLELVLVLGNDVESVTITGRCQKKYERFTKECLLTAKWETQIDPDLPNKIPFTVVPTPDLALKQFHPGSVGVTYRLDVNALLPKDDALFSVWCSNFEQATKNRRQYFDLVLPGLVENRWEVSKFVAEKIQPVAIGTLEGFECFGAAYNNHEQFQAFCYTAMLFKTDTDGYILMAAAAMENRERFEPQFVQMARSFKLK
jgi:hypothetical protein